MEDLKKEYDADKPMVDNKYMIVTTSLSDLIRTMENLLPVLNEYLNMINAVQEISSASRRTVISNIELKISTVSGLISQMRTMKERVEVLYVKSERAVSTAVSTQQSGDVITAQGVYEQLVKSIDAAEVAITDYQKLIVSVRKSVDDLGKGVKGMLPPDESGLVYAVDETGEVGLKNIFVDPIFILFLVAVVGLAIYYFSQCGGYSPQFPPQFPPPQFPPPQFPPQQFPPQFPPPQFPPPQFPPQF